MSDIKYGDLQYRGETKDGRPHGVGEYFREGSLIGHGQSVDGGPAGLFHWADWNGSRYYGEVYHQPEGFGITFYENGDIAAGCWHFSELHGLGVHYCQNPLPIIGKRLRRGRWEHNRHVTSEDKLNSNGTQELQKIRGLLEPFINGTRLQSYLGDGSGCGVYVSKEGLLLTATRNISWGLSRQIDGDIKFETVATDRKLGLSILSTNRAVDHFVPVCTESPDLLEPVLLGGMKLGENKIQSSNVQSSGEINSISSEHLTPDLGLQNTANQLYEGSVLIDQKGNLLSISVADRTVAERIFNVTSGFECVRFGRTEAISKFLKDNGVITSPKAKTIERSTLIENLRKSVVKVYSTGDLTNI